MTTSLNATAYQLLVYMLGRCTDSVGHNKMYITMLYNMVYIILINIFKGPHTHNIIL